MIAQTSNLTSDPISWVLIALGLATILYLSFKPFFEKKKRDTSSIGTSFRMSPAQQRQLEREMQGLVVELSEMVRNLQGQLDTRSAKLDILIREADTKIEELRTLNSQATLRHADHLAGEPDSEFSRPIMRLAGEPSLEVPKDRYTALYDLADQGLDARAIASRLNKPAGEVELILALRTRRRSDPLDDETPSEPPALATRVS